MGRIVARHRIARDPDGGKIKQQVMARDLARAARGEDGVNDIGKADQTGSDAGFLPQLAQGGGLCALAKFDPPAGD